MSDNKSNLTEYLTPLIPLAPVLSVKSLSFVTSKTKKQQSILGCSNKLQLTSGRAAIAIALEHAGIAKNDEVLVPAYHCESMISPVHWRNATPVFYKININTSINVDNIILNITPKTKAIIVTHYFGFLQELTSIRAVCNEHNIILIEDCAHAFFGSLNNQVVGSIGDYAIASSMKFFPCYDGGILASSTRPLGNVNLKKPTLIFQIKAFFNIIERAIYYKRFGIAGKGINALLKVKEWLWNNIKSVSGEHYTCNSPASSDGGYGLEEDWIHKSTSVASNLIIKQSNTKLIIEKRVENYQKIHEALSGLTTAHPLFTKIENGFVPLVFPLYVDAPEQSFDVLKKQGIPIWRFGEYLDKQITEAFCPNSTALSAHVFQFPCHQELTNQELNWMIITIKKTIK
ncbi:aminotransferase class I/II-fold pyridoxal phosphate-dependent enzyme [Neptunomonas qingdaonensis]|uniref:dTDP-4-amino-4,6-dideoxygalactose transaminase n=1 Tax=Neptunomonas qingdaonensis TaxID=1045558 RepID=A0A1I2MZM0_9GAMM|nr:aminotransferase class I/II-fold pyridoxal phosphate-dependent enzyme [Neptunomonas qingdaonensis]SFF94907.1 dTDP-4-amino-4,6-dideoxygalactose transaminase [Neptunomonas qingdaonensis]